MNRNNMQPYNDFSFNQMVDMSAIPFNNNMSGGSSSIQSFISSHDSQQSYRAKVSAAISSKMEEIQQRWQQLQLNAQFEGMVLVSGNARGNYISQSELAFLKGQLATVGYNLLRIVFCESLQNQRNKLQMIISQINQRTSGLFSEIKPYIQGIDQHIELFQIYLQQKLQNTSYFEESQQEMELDFKISQEIGLFHLAEILGANRLCSLVDDFALKKAIRAVIHDIGQQNLDYHFMDEKFEFETSRGRFKSIVSMNFQEEFSNSSSISFGYEPQQIQYDKKNYQKLTFMNDFNNYIIQLFLAAQQKILNQMCDLCNEFHSNPISKTQLSCSHSICRQYLQLYASQIFNKACTFKQITLLRCPQCNSNFLNREEMTQISDILGTNIDQNFKMLRQNNLIKGDRCQYCGQSSNQYISIYIIHIGEYLCSQCLSQYLSNVFKAQVSVEKIIQDYTQNPYKQNCNIRCPFSDQGCSSTHINGLTSLLSIAQRNPIGISRAQFNTAGILENQQNANISPTFPLNPPQQPRQPQEAIVPPNYNQRQQQDRRVHAQNVGQPLPIVRVPNQVLPQPYPQQYQSNAQSQQFQNQWHLKIQQLQAQSQSNPNNPLQQQPVQQLQGLQRQQYMGQNNQTNINQIVPTQAVYQQQQQQNIQRQGNLNCISCHQVGGNSALCEHFQIQLSSQSQSLALENRSLSYLDERGNSSERINQIQYYSTSLSLNTPDQQRICNGVQQILYLYGQKIDKNSLFICVDCFYKLLPVNQGTGCSFCGSSIQKGMYIKIKGPAPPSPSPGGSGSWGEVGLMSHEITTDILLTGDLFEFHERSPQRQQQKPAQQPQPSLTEEEIEEKRKADNEKCNQLAKELRKQDLEEDYRRTYFVCKICCEEYKKDLKMIILPCEHQFCKDCVINHAKTWFEERKRLEDLGCLLGKEQCISERKKEHPDVEIDEMSEYMDLHQNIYRKIIGPRNYDKRMLEELTSSSQKTKKCDCGQLYEIELDENNRKTVYCQNCQKHKCKVCLKDEHVGNCRLYELIENLKPENWPVLDGFKAKIGICPYCAELYAKDQNCQHVDCTKCKKQFNFCCSSKRAPTLAHGSHYHRETCEFVQDFDEDQREYMLVTSRNDPKNEKCEECKQLGKLCPRPGKLFKGVFPSEMLPMFLTPDEISQLEASENQEEVQQQAEEGKKNQ